MFVKDNDNWRGHYGADQLAAACRANGWLRAGLNKHSTDCHALNYIEEG